MAFFHLQNQPPRRSRTMLSARYTHTHSEWGKQGDERNRVFCWFFRTTQRADTSPCPHRDRTRTSTCSNTYSPSRRVITYLLLSLSDCGWTGPDFITYLTAAPRRVYTHTCTSIAARSPRMDFALCLQNCNSTKITCALSIKSLQQRYFSEEISVVWVTDLIIRFPRWR